MESDWTPLAIPLYLIATMQLVRWLSALVHEGATRRWQSEVLAQMRLGKHMLGNVLHAANLRCELLKVEKDAEE